MPRLYAYILNQLLTATGLILSTLAVALWLTQSLRFLELAVNGGAGLSEFMTLVLFTLPKFLTVLLPIAAGIGVIFVYNKLLNDSELVVMRAVGFSQWTLAQPALLLSLGTALTLLALHTYAQPLSKWQFRQQQEELTARFSDVLIKPGVFNTLGGDLTLYVRERQDRGEMRGIVFHDSRNPAAPVIIMAERGVLREGPGGPQVIVYNGIRQEPQAAPGRLQQLSFDRYVIDLALFDRSAEKEIPGIGERTIWQLLWPEEPTDPQTMRTYVAEAHSQLSQPLYGLAIPLAILAILLTGEFSRRGQSKRIFGAMMLLSLLEAATLGLSDAAMRGWWGAIAMYAVPLLTTACALMVLMGRPKRLFQRSAPPRMPDDSHFPPAPGGGPYQPELPPSGLGPRPAYLNSVR